MGSKRWGMNRRKLRQRRRAESFTRISRNGANGLAAKKRKMLKRKSAQGEPRNVGRSRDQRKGARMQRRDGGKEGKSSLGESIPCLTRTSLRRTNAEKDWGSRVLGSGFHEFGDVPIFDPLARPGGFAQEGEAGFHRWIQLEAADRNAPPHLTPAMLLDELIEDVFQRDALQGVAGMGSR